MYIFSTCVFHLVKELNWSRKRNSSTSGYVVIEIIIFFRIEDINIFTFFLKQTDHFQICLIFNGEVFLTFHVLFLYWSFVIDLCHVLHVFCCVVTRRASVASEARVQSEASLWSRRCSRLMLSVCPSVCLSGARFRQRLVRSS